MERAAVVRGRGAADGRRRLIIAVDLARAWGVPGPSRFGFAGSAVVLVLIWRQLAHMAHAGEDVPRATGATGAVVPS